MAKRAQDQKNIRPLFFVLWEKRKKKTGHMHTVRGTSMTTEKSFSQHYRNFERDRECLQKHAAASIKSMRLAKATAYRMATAFLAMQSQDHNQLLNLIRSDERYANLKDPVTVWVDDSFAPLGLVGCEHYELIRAIGQGMKMAEYMSTTPKMFISKKKLASVAARTNVPLPTAPTANDSPEKQAEFWRLRAEALEARMKELERESREKDRRLALLEREFARVQRIGANLKASA